ncbi:MAG: N-acetylneuraminate synthase family protein [Gammaproteobacteria bacterium]|nr:N-acetylneuraminate synthase family protein [Gammaproteobacteria bacterium]
MSVVTFRNGRRVGDYLKPYIVAELNTSHFGNMDIARDMIDKARAVGCDCVKFQSWSAETLYCESYYKENTIAKRIVNKFALDRAQLKELSLYSEEQGIDFSSTPYSIEEAKFLVTECNVPFVKIASMELNNLPYLTQLGQLGVPLVLSTGMGTFEEIIEAVETIQSTGNDQLIILHCTSVYPASPEIIRLQNIVGLRSEFPSFPIGYSDHSQGLEIPAASVALGACIIEKHFTLDCLRIGMDNQMATEPEEMQAMVKACHRVYEALGGCSRILGDDEKAQIPKMRRSMVAKIDLKPGEALSEDCIEFKRPATGIQPSKFKTHIGRTVKRHIDAGSIIQPQDLS